MLQETNNETIQSQINIQIEKLKTNMQKIKDETFGNKCINDITVYIGNELDNAIKNGKNPEVYDILNDAYIFKIKFKKEHNIQNINIEKNKTIFNGYSGLWCDLNYIDIIHNEFSLDTAKNLIINTFDKDKIYSILNIKTFKLLDEAYITIKFK